jgi:hypothetical protein
LLTTIATIDAQPIDPLPTKPTIAYDDRSIADKPTIANTG